MNLGNIKIALLQLILEAKMTPRDQLVKISTSNVEVKMGREQTFINLAKSYYVYNGKNIDSKFDLGALLDSVYCELLYISKKDKERNNLYKLYTNMLDNLVEESKSFDLSPVFKRLDEILNLSREAVEISQQMKALSNIIEQEEAALGAKKKTTNTDLSIISNRIEAILSESAEYDDSAYRARMDEILLESTRARKVASDGKKVKATLILEYEELLKKVRVSTSDFNLVNPDLIDEYERLRSIYLAYSSAAYKKEEEKFAASKRKYQELAERLDKHFKVASDSSTISIDYFDEYERLLKQSRQKLVETSDGKKVKDIYKNDYEELLYAVENFKDAQNVDSIDRVYEIIKELIEKENISFDRLDEEFISQANAFYTISDEKREALFEYRRMLELLKRRAYPRIEDFKPDPNVIYLGGNISNDVGSVEEPNVIDDDRAAASLGENREEVSEAFVSEAVEVANDGESQEGAHGEEEIESFTLGTGEAADVDAISPNDELTQDLTGLNGDTHDIGGVEELEVHDEGVAQELGAQDGDGAQELESHGDGSLGSESDSLELGESALNDGAKNTFESVASTKIEREFEGVAPETKSGEILFDLDAFLLQFEDLKSSSKNNVLEENEEIITQLENKIIDFEVENDERYDYIICLYRQLISMFKSAKSSDDLVELSDGSKIKRRDCQEYSSTIQSVIDETNKIQKDASNNKSKKKNRRVAKPKKDREKKKWGLFGKKKGGKREKKSFVRLVSDKFNAMNKLFSEMFKSKTSKLVFVGAISIVLVPAALISIFAGYIKNSKNNNEKNTEPKVNSSTLNTNSRANSRLSMFIPYEDEKITFMNGVVNNSANEVDIQSDDTEIELELGPIPVDPRVESISRAAEGPDEYFYGLTIEEKIEYVKEAFNISYAEFNEYCYEKQGSEEYNMLKPYRDAINNEMMPIILENGNVSAENLDIVASTVNHEGGSTYAEAYGVSSVFLNRINDEDYVRSHGTSVYKQCVAPTQFESYFDGYYRQFLGKETIAKQAFYDALYSKTTIHNWKSFRAWYRYDYSDNYITEGGNRYNIIFNRLNPYTEEDMAKDEYYKDLFELQVIIDNIHYDRSR